MASYGLKTNIAVNVALLLFFGMALTAFMTTNLIQRLLVISEISKGNLLLSAIEEHFVEVPAPINKSEQLKEKFSISRILSDSGISYAIIVFPEDGKSYEFGTVYANKDAMEINAKKSCLLNKRMEAYTGDGWGVFWKQKQDLIISTPLGTGSEPVAGISVLISLEPVFKSVRRAQRLIFIYILINGFVLTLAGVYQISKYAVKPLQRLLKRADEYHIQGQLVFEEKSGNEFKKLSTALNNMLGKISYDTGQLEETIVSLEKANKDLKKAQNDIVRAEKLASVGRLSSGIAHEIGNPLGIVSGYLELIKSEDIPVEQKQDFINRAEKEIERIDSIIRQLLDYSRVSHSKNNNASVHEIIYDVAEMLKVQPLMAGVELRLDLSAEKDMISGNTDQLHQVFLNLSINAADAISLVEGKTKGSVSISTTIEKNEITESVNDGFLKISFKDNGVGISQENMGNIFDPFFTTKEPGKGTGLGLSVCFMLVDDMGGKIVAESEVGVGTSVNLFFPLI